MNFNSNSNSVQLAPGLQSKPTLAPRSAHEIPHTRPECWRSSASTRNADKVCEHLCCWYLPPPPQFASSITSSTPQHYNDRSNSSSSTNVSAPIPSPKRAAQRTPSLHNICLAPYGLRWRTCQQTPVRSGQVFFVDTVGTVGSRWLHPLVAFHTEESSTTPSIAENTQAGTCQVYTDATEARGRPTWTWMVACCKSCRSETAVPSGVPTVLTWNIGIQLRECAQCGEAIFDRRVTPQRSLFRGPSV